MNNTGVSFSETHFVSSPLRTSASHPGGPGPRRGYAVVPRGGALLPHHSAVTSPPGPHDPARQATNLLATLRFVRGEGIDERWGAGPREMGWGTGGSKARVLGGFSGHL